MCGSGMRAAMFAHDMLMAGSHEVLVAGGMESMTNAPHLLPKGRSGIRIGHDRVLDHMMLDGLEDAYEPGRSMGTFGEDCAAKYGFTARTARRLCHVPACSARKAATAAGAFDAEITPVTVADPRRRGAVCRTDEGPGKSQARQDPHAQSLPSKKTAPSPPRRAASINDGAAATGAWCAAAAPQTTGVAKPLARIVEPRHPCARARTGLPRRPVGAIAKGLGQGRLGRVPMWTCGK